MKTEKEIRQEARRIRERARNLSGFWTSELAAAVQALEWALDKHPRPPSEDIGSKESAQGRIAAALLKAAENGAPARKPAAAKRLAAAKKPGRGPRRV